MMNKSNPNDNPWRAMGMVSAFAADLIVCMIAGFFAGRWIGGMINGHPIWSVIGVMVGFLVGVASVIIIIRTFMGDRHG
jgi:ATP synthase protein I